MLSDQFAEFCTILDDVAGNLPKSHHDAHLAYLAKIQKSPRFVLDRTSNFLINDLKERTFPSKLLSILRMIRLPFPSMWVEFPFQDRVDWVAQAEGYFSEHAFEADPPKRLGFLLEQQDEHTVTIHPVWSHDATLMNLCPMALSIDTEPRSPYQPSPEELTQVTHKGPGNSWAARWMKDDAEVLACADLQNRITPVVPQCMQAMSDDLMTLAPDLWTQMKSASAYDLAGEWHFIMLLLCLLNSRNIVEFGEEEAYTKLNKQRVKKGKPPLLSHRPITISLSRVQRNRTQWEGSGSGTGKERAASLVMGHLKVRKTGVFWWGPHVRDGKGSASPRDYRVVA